VSQAQVKQRRIQKIRQHHGLQGIISIVIHQPEGTGKKRGKGTANIRHPKRKQQVLWMVAGKRHGKK